MPSAQAVYAQLADESIRNLVENQTDAWNRNDAKGWAKDFLEEASLSMCAVTW